LAQCAPELERFLLRKGSKVDLLVFGPNDTFYVHRESGEHYCSLPPSISDFLNKYPDSGKGNQRFDSDGIQLLVCSITE
jgi:hypothetical protein